MASGTFYPAVSGDDGLRYGASSFNTNWTTSYLGRATNDYKPFIRFPNVTIPNGAVITNAFIKFKASQTASSTICNLKLQFNDEDNAVAPTSYGQYDALVKTSAVVNWNNVSVWTQNVSYNSIDTSSLIQEIVDRAGWSSGNAMMFLGDDNGSDDNTFKRFYTYDNGSGYPELHITWIADIEITLPDPFLVVSSVQSNIQVELVPGVLSAESSMSVSEVFWGNLVELPFPFAAESSLQVKTGLEIAVTPLIAQTNLQSNLQIELVPFPFLTQSEMSVGEVFWGYQIDLPSAFSANASLQANTQIELVTAPLIATGELLSNLGIEVSAGALNATGSILATPVYPIILTGTRRIYLFTLTGTSDGMADIIIPISSFQSRIKSGDPTYLSVSIPGTEYASAINARLNGDLVIRMGYSDKGTILLTEIIARVAFENIRIDEGPTNKSITLDGHKTETWIPKTVSLEKASYYNLTGGKLRYRCKPDLYLRPGDIANINDDSFTVESITYSVSPVLETFEVSE